MNLVKSDGRSNKHRNGCQIQLVPAPRITNFLAIVVNQSGLRIRSHRNPITINVLQVVPPLQRFN
jgi:hypothetical protein